MKLRTLTLALGTLVLTPCVLAQSVPLESAEILGRLAQGSSPSYIAVLVKTRGISFSPTEEFLSRVMLAGGEGILVERISSSNPPPGINSAKPDRPFERLAKCVELIHTGAAEQAEPECRAAMEENPESPWPVVVTIRALAELGLPPEERVELLRRVVALDPKLAMAHRLLAGADISPQERAEEMQKVAALEQGQTADSPGQAGAFTGGLALRGIPEVGSLPPEVEQQIRDHIQSLLNEDSELAAVRLALALDYCQLGASEKAHEELREALRLEPGNPELHAALGNFYQAQHNVEAELAEFREAARIAPYQNLQRRYLTQALVREQRSEEAIREWRNFLALAPRDVAASDFLVNLHLEQHDRKAAITELRRSLKASADSSANEGEFVEARTREIDRLAHLLADNGEFDAAAEQYALLLRFIADSAPLHKDLGNVLFAERRFDEAGNEYREALRLQPDLPDAHHNLANCLFLAQKVDDAVGEYQQSLELDPDKYQSRMMLGAALTQKGELNAAIEQFQQVLAQNPENAGAHANLGHAFYMNKDIPSAIAELKRALAIKPDYAAAQNELAGINADARNPRALAEDLALNSQSTEAVATAQQDSELDP